MYGNTIFRFAIVGGANTVATAALLVVLSFYVPGWLAFAISFALGIGFSVALTGRWVFQSYVSVRRSILFIVAYVGIFLCGLAVIQFLYVLEAPPVANGAAIFVTAPLSFVAGRLIFTNGNRKQVK